MIQGWCQSAFKKRLRRPERRCGPQKPKAGSACSCSCFLLNSLVTTPLSFPERTLEKSSKPLKRPQSLKAKAWSTSVFIVSTPQSCLAKWVDSPFCNEKEYEDRVEATMLRDNRTPEFKIGSSRGSPSHAARRGGKSGIPASMMRPKKTPGRRIHQSKGTPSIPLENRRETSLSCRLLGVCPHSSVADNSDSHTSEIFRGKVRMEISSKSYGVESARECWHPSKPSYTPLHKRGVSRP